MISVTKYKQIKYIDHLLYILVDLFDTLELLLHENWTQ